MVKNKSLSDINERTEDRDVGTFVMSYLDLINNMVIYGTTFGKTVFACSNSFWVVFLTIPILSSILVPLSGNRITDNREIYKLNSSYLGRLYTPVVVRFTKHLAFSKSIKS